MNPLLEVDGVSIRYGQALAVDRVDLVVMPGERVALIGANGAGKTSLLNAICGCTAPAGGHVRIDGEDVTKLRAAEIVRRGVVQVPEGRQVFPRLTVEANLRLGAFGRTFRTEFISSTLRYLAQGDLIDARLESVLELMPKLRELLGRPAGLTSGGEQQMVAIGRALMADPRLLAIDELSLGLAPLVVESLAAFLRDINEERGVALLLVEQNTHLAFDLCERAYVLESGRCVLQGPSAELRDRRDVQDAYLGTAVGI